MESAVRRDLSQLPDDLAQSALAASSIALAREMDSPNSATSKSMVARALLDTLDRLRELAPDDEGTDELDDLATRRQARLDRGTAASHL